MDRLSVIAPPPNSAAPNLGNARRPTVRRAGFTLVELLVVIGIIALLISILLPALGKAREQGNAIKCLSNLRSMGTAFLMYANNNKGALPADSVGGSTYQEDFLFWQPGRDIQESALATYLGKPLNTAVLICPSDDVNNRTRTASGGYRFSYVMNGYCSPIANSGISTLDNIKKITQAVNVTEKLLAYEEDPYTLDDGHATPYLTSEVNLLALRHDGTRRPENPAQPLLAFVANGSKRGNVAFLDGHAAFTDRNTVHSPVCYLPKRRMP